MDDIPIHELDFNLAKKYYGDNPNILAWNHFYGRAYEVYHFLDLAQGSTDIETIKRFNLNAQSKVFSLQNYIWAIPPEWSNIHLHFKINGKLYSPTYAQIETKMYDLKAKYFELNPERGKYRDPLTRHFPCNRILR